MEHSAAAARWISQMGIDDDRDGEHIYHQIDLFTDSFTDFNFHPSPIRTANKPSSYHVTNQSNESSCITNIISGNSTKIQTSESMPKPKSEPFTSNSLSKIISFGENESHASQLEEQHRQVGHVNNIVKLGQEAALCSVSNTYDNSCENDKPAAFIMKNHLTTSTGNGNIIGVKRLSTSTISRTSSSFAHDHVVAERKRREKLNQRFIALSALVPSLKKMDKASVLAGAVRYLKELQEQVNVLEKQTATKAVESVIYVKKSRFSLTDETSSSDESSGTDQLSSDCLLPEIEARICNDSVLIKIHCENSPSRGTAAGILIEIEKLKLTVMSSHIVPFGSHAIDITIVAKMEDSSSPPPKELIGGLRQAVANAMRSTKSASFGRTG